MANFTTGFLQQNSVPEQTGGRKEQERLSREIRRPVRDGGEEQRFYATQVQANPERRAHDYAPAETITIADGATETMEFRGRSGDAFAFDRLTVGGDYEGLTVTAKTNTGTTVLFAGAHLSALRRLFLRRRLRGLLEVNEGNRLELDVTNRSGSESTVCVQLGAYSTRRGLEAQRECLRSAYGYVPRPKLVSAFASIPAGASAQRVKIEQRPSTIYFWRWMVAADDEAALDSWRVKLRVYERTVREEVFASQIKDQFTDGETSRPYVVAPKTPMQVIVDSDAQADLGFSALFEGYYLQQTNQQAGQSASTRYNLSGDGLQKGCY